MEGSRRGDGGVNEGFKSGSGVRRLEMDNTSKAYELGAALWEFG